MKTLVLFFLLLGTTAWAADKPLIIKSSGGGFVMPDYARFESCEVFKDKVLVTKTYGRGEKGFTLSETRSIALSPGVVDVIEKARQERLESKDNLMCDAPSTYIRLGDNGEKDLLFRTGGCGSPRLDRVGPFSSALKDLVNTYCPLTFDYQR